MFKKVLKNPCKIDIKTKEPSFHLTEMSAIERHGLYSPRSEWFFMVCCSKSARGFLFDLGSAFAWLYPLHIPYETQTKDTPKNPPVMRARDCMKFTTLGTNWETPNLYNVDTSVKRTPHFFSLVSLL